MEDIKGLERLISIWSERNVYDASLLAKLHKCLGEYSALFSLTLKFLKDLVSPTAKH